MNKKKTTAIPPRSSIKVQDTWNLELLFPSLTAWEKSLQKVKKDAARFARYEKTLKEDVEYIHRVYSDYLKLSEEFSQLGAYAALAYSSDLTNSTYQSIYAKVQGGQVDYQRATSFLAQELLTLSRPFLKKLSQYPPARNYRQEIRRIIRSKPHVLSVLEEKLLAEQAGYSNGFENSFEALLNTDLRFGKVKTTEGEVELSSSTLSILLENPKAAVRKQAFLQFYQEIKAHKNVLSNIFASQIQMDCARARIRKHPSALKAALHHNNIPELIYQDLIKSTRRHLPLLHRYYRILNKIIPVKGLAVYDLYYNPFKPPKVNMEYDEAVEHIIRSLQPLGEEYTRILHAGLLEGRWVDRYESKGKRSGAFSYPVYNKPPYILMNYKKESINSMFTLTHEAGHSMHSYLSNQTNSFAHFHYSIFEAEIASTLNEYLLSRHLLENESAYRSKASQTYLVLDKLHSFTSTFFRQVMFAEFEYNVHRHCEQSTPLTADLFIDEYQKLSKDYYGKDVQLPEENGLVGLRIPHFYSCFYVYQYATGIACAHSLGKNIYEEYHRSNGRNRESAEKTFKFLKSAGSRYPLESLGLAGVEFTSGKIIEDAMKDYKSTLDRLEELVGWCCLINC